MSQCRSAIRLSVVIIAASGTYQPVLTRHSTKCVDTPLLAEESLRTT
jgi:hypothetical protein